MVLEKRPCSEARVALLLWEAISTVTVLKLEYLVRDFADCSWGLVAEFFGQFGHRRHHWRGSAKQDLRVVSRRGEMLRHHLRIHEAYPSFPVLWWLKVPPDEPDQNMEREGKREKANTGISCSTLRTLPDLRHDRA